MFGIDESNVITYAADGEPPGSVAVFGTKKQLEATMKRLNWSKADVTAVWNANVGTGGFDERVKRFRNRPYGIDRIWDAVQGLKGEPGTEKAAAPNKEAATNGKPRAATNDQPRKPRAPRPPKENSRRSEVVALLARDEGVNVPELQKRFGWEAHSARGFLSTLRSKHGVKIETEKDESRGRVYKAV